jgi:hypothetical protein
MQKFTSARKNSKIFYDDVGNYTPAQPCAVKQSAVSPHDIFSPRLRALQRKPDNNIEKHLR